MTVRTVPSRSVVRSLALEWLNARRLTGTVELGLRIGIHQTDPVKTATGDDTGLTNAVASNAGDCLAQFRTSVEVIGSEISEG